jgi:hypothetical protein
VRTVEANTGTNLALALTWTSLAVMRGGVKAIIYHESAGNADLDSVLAEGVPSGSGVVIVFADGTNPVVAGARIAIKGRFRAV